MILNDIFFFNQNIKLYLGNDLIYPKNKQYIPGKQASNTTVTYSDSLGSPTVTTDEHGNVSIYTMNIESGNTVDITNNSGGVDTGLVPFTGDSLHVHLDCTINTSDLSASGQKHVLNMYRVPESGKYSGLGFYIFVSNSKFYLSGFYAATDGSSNTYIKLNNQNSYGALSTSARYIFDIVKSGTSYTINVTVDGTSIHSSTVAIESNRDDITVSVGQRYDSNRNPAGFCPMKIHEFYATKL